MKILFLLFSLLGFFGVNGQPAKGNTWVVTHNKVVRLKATGEDETKNNITLKAADLKKEGQLTVSYTEEKKLKGWKRIFAIVDEKDNELISTTGSSFKISNVKLRSLLSNSSTTIKLYTWALPTDPELASRIRIRRVHVCTIQLAN